MLTLRILEVSAFHHLPSNIVWGNIELFSTIGLLKALFDELFEVEVYCCRANCSTFKAIRIGMLEKHTVGIVSIYQIPRRAVPTRAIHSEYQSPEE